MISQNHLRKRVGRVSISEPPAQALGRVSISQNHLRKRVRLVHSSSPIDPPAHAGGSDKA